MKHLIERLRRRPHNPMERLYFAMGWIEEATKGSRLKTCAAADVLELLETIAQERKEEV
jgi:hypothetical protein